MLNTLQIKNVALISENEINFKNGFNVLLGETGAGKSIIFDALNFVLGYKADKTLIRNGEESMKVISNFSSNSIEVKNLLKEFDIDFDGEVILSRSLNLQGKSECRINGEVVAVGMLKQLGGLLLDTYGQHENQLLLKNKNYLGILDSYCGNLIVEDKNKLVEVCQKITDVNKEINALGGSNENREKQIDFLSYQIKEIKESNIQDNEDEEIKSYILRLSNQEKITTSLSNSINLLSEEENNILQNLKTANRNLQSISEYDEDILNLSKRLESSLFEIEDISMTLEDIISNYNFDENELDEKVKRQDLINLLKRKYGGSIEEIKKSLNDFEEQLYSLQNSAEILEKKNEEKQALIKEYHKVAIHLSETRKHCAEILEKSLTSQLAEVGMKNSVFKVDFKNYAEEDFSNSTQGIDEIDFLFSANFGEELKQLSKTISGGEMSRFMLVFKNVLASKGEIETLVFDEIDSGISGVVASAVAEKIAMLSKTYQILCITHLPQVAVMADNYFYVSKEVQNNRTISKAEEVVGDNILDKIATMTGGDNKNETTLEYVKNLKHNANQFKNSRA